MWGVTFTCTPPHLLKFFLSQKLSYIISLLENTTYGLSALKNAITSSSSGGVNTSIKGISVFNMTSFSFSDSSSERGHCLAKFIAPVTGMYRLRILTASSSYRFTSNIYKYGNFYTNASATFVIVDSNTNSRSSMASFSNWLDPYYIYRHTTAGESVVGSNYKSPNLILGDGYIDGQSEIEISYDFLCGNAKIVPCTDYANNVGQYDFYCCAGEPVVLMTTGRVTGNYASTNITVQY